MTIRWALVLVAMAALLLSTRVAARGSPIARTAFEETSLTERQASASGETRTQGRLNQAANGVQIPRKRGAADHDKGTLRRRLEDDYNADQGDDDSLTNFEKGAQYTFGDMFYTSPSTWSALEWGIFAGLLTLFGICFCCWCLACVIPRCCGNTAPLLYYAAMTPNKQGLLV